MKENVKFRFPVYPEQECMKQDISVLELSVRANNCLRRADIHTVRDLVLRIDSEDDLRRLRQCGSTSVREIMEAVFLYQYEQLSDHKKERFMKRLYELNEENILKPRLEELLA